MTAWVFAIAVCVSIHHRDYCSRLTARYPQEDICDHRRAALSELFADPKLTVVCIKIHAREPMRFHHPLDLIEDTRRL